MEKFKKSILIESNVKKLFEWHEKKSALMRLNPPWERIKLINQEGIDNDSRTIMKVYQGPIGIKLIFRHYSYLKNKLFVDEQIKGPFKYWKHYHIFEEINESLSNMTDEIEYEIKFKPVSNLFNNNIKNKIIKMFNYRHNILKNDFILKKKYNLPTKNIAITGASGILGKYLVNFLDAQGHNVVPLSRNYKSNENINWNPNAGDFTSCLSCSDVVIHLAGEPVSDGRWTKNKMVKILNSRVKGTNAIAKQLARLKKPPKLLICASAIGYYGDRGREVLTESSNKGDGFIAEVCEKWEKAAMPAIDKGIRVVFLRIGVVLTPEGGALKKFLLPFNLNLGGTLGRGEHYLSWILPDDVAGIVLHVISNENICGAVNVVSPNPVQHNEFTKILGNILKKPVLIKIPENLIKLAFGQMGKELLLSSTKVLPEKLNKSGYNFLYSDLTNALKHITGYLNE